MVTPSFAQVAPECKFGMEAPAAKPLSELVSRAQGILLPNESLVGAWLDRCGPCSIIVIANAPRRGLDQIDICADGSTSRDRQSSPDKVARSPLQPTKAPAGARRAWQTPGLKCRSTIILGQATTECLTSDGDRDDRNTFVELLDGTLLQYQDGVGLTNGKVVVRAAPLDLNKQPKKQ